MLIALPLENLISHLPPRLSLSASFLTSHFLMIISVIYVTQAIFVMPCSRPPTRANYKIATCTKFAACLVTCTPWREHTSPVMMQLHWLPIAQRIEYKTIALAFQDVHCTAPSYLCILVDRYRSKKELHSGRGAILLQQPRFMSTSGNRAFAIAVPKLWNSLPEGLRMISDYSEFRKKLKSHLFRKAYQHLL